MAKIIGLSGKRGSGKDTVANHIKTRYPAHFRALALADPIRAMLKAGFGWDASYFEHPLKDQVVEGLGKAPRDFMKPLGTEWGRDMIGEDLWLNLLIQRVEPLIGSGLNVIVTDVRFENEADWVRKSGGEIWHVSRGGVEVDPHVSEAGIRVLRGDKHIDNNNTIGWLYDRAEVLAGGVVGDHYCGT